MEPPWTRSQSGTRFRRSRLSRSWNLPCAALRHWPPHLSKVLILFDHLPTRSIMEGGIRNMANLDWSHCPAVESIPGKVSGAWVFRGTRVPVSAVFENLKTSPIEEVLENFHVTRDQVQTVLDSAAKSAQPPVEALHN